MKKIQLLKTICLLAVSSLCFSSMAFAGGGLTGGGNVLRCYTINSQGQKEYSYQLLDYYDVMKPNGNKFTLDLGPGKTYQEKINYVLNRLEKRDPYRADLYRKMTKSFFAESEMIDVGPRATDSNDLGSGYILPKGCKIIRIVIQKSDEEMALTESPYKYEIVKSVWDNLDEDTIAGMILHEVAYREAILRGAKSSLQIRRYVGLISSNEISKVNYPLEILKSGLMFWGEKYDFSDKNYVLDGVLDRSATNFIIYNPQFTKSISETNISTFMDYKLNGQIISCRHFDYHANVINPSIHLITFYSQLTSAQGINLDDIGEGKFTFQHCKNQFRISNEMFKNSKHSFELYGNAKGNVKLKDDPYSLDFFNLTKNSFENFYIEKGIIDGVEVSNLLCNFNEETDLVCKNIE